MRQVLAQLLTGAALLLGCRTSPQSEASPAAPESSAASPNAELRGTRWVLHRLNQQEVPVAAGSAPYLVLQATQGLAEGSAGCNRFRGTFEQLPSAQLRFGPLLTTKMACPAMATESAFLEALSQARTYRISGDTLRLYPSPQAPPNVELLAGAPK